MKMAEENNPKQQRNSKIYAGILALLAVGFYAAFIFMQFLRSQQ